MRRIFSRVLIILLLGAARVRADDVSRTPPKVYGDHLAALLTPAAEMLKRPLKLPDGSQSGITVLSESVEWVDDNGSAYIAEHSISVARNDQGAQQISKDQIGFLKSENKIHLVLARSVQVDGGSQDLAANASFIQTPQRDGEDSLYTDQAELVLLYPNVKTGTATESIVVIERPKARIEGQFTAILDFASYWPQMRVRNVIDLPATLAARVKVTSLGDDVPPIQRQVLGGRVRLTWQRNDIPATEWESDRAPSRQVGPAVFLTTLNDWNAVGDWIRSLLKTRESVKNKLAADIEKTTNGITDRDAIITKLLTAAADDVRYTGLEFGQAGYQPYDPNDVWSNHYGDCKDKANLLRVMLRAKKIPADLVVLNTNHAGLVEKRSPDYRMFDHAIVAIEQAGGKYLFCDPTIKYARPGMLRPDDADRDVLVIKDNGTEFVHTPPQSLGMNQYSFDLKLAMDGTLSGWMTIQSTGYRATLLRDYLSDKEHQILRSDLKDILQGFYKTADLIDIDTKGVAGPGDQCTARVYFVQNGASLADRQRDTLIFPASSGLIPDLSDGKQRDTIYLQSLNDKHVICHIQLPAGWIGVELPRPFQVETSTVRGGARWDIKGNTVIATLDYTPLVAAVSPDQYPLLYTAVTSLQAWISKPLSISCNPNQVTVTTQPSEIALTDFPLMTTGGGQLDLVDHRFPIEGNLDQRRAALLKVMQWFPDDTDSQFNAAIQIARIDFLQTPHDKAVIKRVEGIITAARGRVDQDTIAWASYIMARQMGDAGDSAGAWKIFDEMAGNAKLSSFRRAWSAICSARLVKQSDPAAGIKVLQKTLPLLDSTALPEEYVELVELLAAKPPTTAPAATMPVLTMDLLRDDLLELARQSPEHTREVLSELMKESDTLIEANKSAQAMAMLASLEEVVAQNDGFASFRTEISKVRDNTGVISAYTQIVAEIKSYFAAHPPAWWDVNKLAKPASTHQEYRKRIGDAGNLPDVDAYLRYVAAYLLQQRPNPDDFAKSMWELASSLQSHHRDADLIDHLLQWIERTPDGDEYYQEGRFVRATQLLDLGKQDAAIDVLKSIIDNPRTTPIYHHGAMRRIGSIYEAQKNFPSALQMYKGLETDIGSNQHDLETLIRAIELNLETGHPEEAMRLCVLLTKVSDDLVKGSDYAWQLRGYIAIGKDPQAGQQFWKRQAKWWPLWNTFIRKVSSKSRDEVIAPTIKDLTGYGKEIETAQRAGDVNAFARLLDQGAHLARWDSRMVPELASFYSTLSAYQPAAVMQFRPPMILALRDLQTPDAFEAKVGKIQLAAMLIDTFKAREALDLMLDYRATYKDSDNFTYAAGRLMALAAVSENRKLDIAASELAADLQGDVNERAKSVTFLCNVYEKTGQLDEEQALLARELSNPAVRADAPEYDQLTARQNRFHLTAENRFSSFIARWIREHKPGWYEYAQPKTLQEYAGQDLDGLLNNPPSYLLPAEVAKLSLLIAEDNAQPLARRRIAFNTAAYQIIALCRRHDEAQALYRSLYTALGPDDEFKSYWLCEAINEGGAEAGEIEPLMSNPLAANFENGQKLLVQLANLRMPEATSTEKLELFADTLLKNPIGPFEYGLLSRVFNRALQIDAAAAERIIKKCEKMTLTSDMSESAATIRLHFLKAIKTAQRWHKADEAARQLIFKATQSRVLSGTRDSKQCIDADGAAYFGGTTELNYRYQAFLAHRYKPGDGDAYSSLVNALNKEQYNPQLGCDVLKALLTDLSEDEDLAPQVRYSTDFFDDDNPDLRAAVLDMVKPYRNEQEYPLAYAEIRLLDNELALRTGQPIDVETAYRHISSTHAKNDELKAKLARYRQAGDTKAVRKTLEALDPDDLGSVMTIDSVLPALEEAGMNDELSIVKESAQHSLYEHTLLCWSSPSAYELRQTCKMAKSLHLMNIAPQAWIQHCTDKASPELVAYLQLRAAQCRQDWPAAVDAADQLIKLKPRTYELNWDKGEALSKSGHDTDAAKAVEPFLKYCHDDTNYNKALQVRAKAK